jgi:hypothetical protein
MKKIKLNIEKLQLKKNYISQLSPESSSLIYGGYMENGFIYQDNSNPQCETNVPCSPLQTLIPQGCPPVMSVNEACPI